MSSKSTSDTLKSTKSKSDLSKTLKKKKAGFINVKITYSADDNELVCDVNEARQIKHTSSYVKCYIMPDKGKSTKQKTEVVKKDSNPWWGEEFRWPIKNTAAHSDHILEITVWEKGMSNDFLGRVGIKLDEIFSKKTIEGWMELLDPDTGKNTYAIIQPDFGADRSGVFKAMYDYEPRGDEELFIRKDDLVKEIEREDDWTKVRNVITNQEGFVPHSYLAPAFSLESEPWFFGPITRSKAEKLLGNPMRKHGCFLIRESESAPGTYSLSMKDGDSVRHFRIMNDPPGTFKLQGSPCDPHNSLHELIEYHKHKRGGLTTVLRDACPRAEQARATDLAFAVKDQWEVSRDTIELISELGKGQYGEVYRGMWKGTTPVAVKTLKQESCSPEEFLAEAQIMKKFKHPNLVQLYAVCTIGEPMFIITELMANGCLLDFLHKPEGEALRLPQLIDMATDVAQGMAYLERNNFIHRDLAARNVLVGENNICKVGDFGFARLVQGEAFTPENLTKFPVRWTAPEAMDTNTYTIKSDVWSYGVFLTELITYGRKPYQGMSNKEVVASLEKGYRMECPPGCPDQLYKLMMDTWKVDPVERPTFEAIVYRLEDFFHSEMQYTEASKVLDEGEPDGK